MDPLDFQNDENENYFMRAMEEGDGVMFEIGVRPKGSMGCRLNETQVRQLASGLMGWLVKRFDPKPGEEECL
jgi:hypothetical protein